MPEKMGKQKKRMNGMSLGPWEVRRYEEPTLSLKNESFLFTCSNTVLAKSHCTFPMGIPTDNVEILKRCPMLRHMS